MKLRIIGEKLRSKINKQEWIVKVFAVIGCVLVLYIALPIIGEWTYYKLKNIYEKGTIITRASVRVVEPAQPSGEDEPDNEPTVSGADNQPEELGVEDQIKQAFEENGSAAVLVASCESGLNPAKESETDRMADGRAFSVGLFQINLTVSELDGVKCNEAFAGRNYAAKVVNEQLYSKCVGLAKDPAVNIKAAERKFDGGGWKHWATCSKRI